ncbi:hypothetical protein [Chroococcidiopsis sp.]|uniref:hypothetical protein n=1 Tax=Chroococcidiopsis sp. TaxID=3088168 RepID=UPI003F2BD8A6
MRHSLSEDEVISVSVARLSKEAIAPQSIAIATTETITQRSCHNSSGDFAAKFLCQVSV